MDTIWIILIVVGAAFFALLLTLLILVCVEMHQLKCIKQRKIKPLLNRSSNGQFTKK